VVQEVHKIVKEGLNDSNSANPTTLADEKEQRVNTNSLKSGK